MSDHTALAGVPTGIMAVLMASVFTVSMGFGVVLPLLPYLIERLLGAGGDAAQVAWLPNASFALITGLMLVGLLINLGLPRMLMKRKHDDAGAKGQVRLEAAIGST